MQRSFIVFVTFLICLRVIEYFVSRSFSLRWTEEDKIKIESKHDKMLIRILLPLFYNEAKTVRVQRYDRVEQLF